MTKRAAHVASVGLAIALGVWPVAAEGAAAPSGHHDRRVEVRPAAAQKKPRARRRAKRATRGAGYAAMVKRWHTREPGAEAPRDAGGRPKLVLEAINLNESVELEASSDLGGFAAADLDRAARTLREPGSGFEFPLDPRLADFLYRLQRRFDAPKIRVISAYRAPRRGSGSRHGQGRAVDLVVPGAKDGEVAAFARGFGFVGVGVYTRSGYVHVDVRHESHSWQDASLPGRRGRPRALPRGEARSSDAVARKSGVAPPRASVVPADDVDRVWQHGAPASQAPQSDAEETEHEAAGSSQSVESKER